MEARQRIIQAAHTLFIQHGYARVSLRQIAQEAGLTKGGVYHHFDSKDALLREVMALLASEIGTWMETTTREDQSTKEKIRSTLEAIAPRLEMYFGSLPDEGGIGHYHLLFEVLRRFPDIRQAFVGSSRVFVGSIEELIEQGKASADIREDIAWEAVALALGALIEGMSLIRAVDPSVDLEKMSTGMFELLWRGLAP